jgi:hypothetical protein
MRIELTMNTNDLERDSRGLIQLVEPQVIRMEEEEEEGRQC